MAPHLVHVFPSFAPGGVPLRTAAIISALGDTYRHTVVALDGRLDAQSRVADGIAVDYFTPRIDKSRPVATVGTIVRTLHRLQPDLLITHNWGSIEWAAVNRLLRAAPHIHLEDGFGREEAVRQLPRRVRGRRFALKSSVQVIVPSETLRRLATDVWRLDPGKVRLVRNGIDCPRYDLPPEPSLVPGIERANGAVVVGTVAPLRAEKDLGHLVRAFARVAPGRNVVLALIGNGNQREALTALVAELGLADRVLMPGHVETPERVYGLLDVFAMSSSTEQMPISLMEAMAAGRPVVATDVGDTSAMVAEANRPFVVPSVDEEAYAAALARLIDDAELRAALGAANRTQARAAFPVERMFETWGEIFATTARRPPCAA